MSVLIDGHEQRAWRRDSQPSWACLCVPSPLLLTDSHIAWGSKVRAPAWRQANAIDDPTGQHHTHLPLGTPSRETGREPAAWNTTQSGGGRWAHVVAGNAFTTETAEVANLKQTRNYASTVWSLPIGRVLPTFLWARFADDFRK